jgi:hypothetical protein
VYLVSGIGDAFTSIGSFRGGTDHSGVAWADRKGQEFGCDALRFRKPRRASSLLIVPTGKFNLLAHNQDDQVENIILQMDNTRGWSRKLGDLERFGLCCDRLFQVGPQKLKPIEPPTGFAFRSNTASSGRTS